MLHYLYPKIMSKKKKQPEKIIIVEPKFLNKKNKVKDKPIVFTGNIKNTKKLSPEKFFELILDKLRKGNKVWQDSEKIIGRELINDIIFWKITSQKNELFKQHGKSFQIAYEAYKKGKGKKGRVQLANYLKKEKDKKRLEDLNKRIDRLIENAKKNPDPKNPYMKFFEGEWIDFSPTALAKRLQDERNKTKLDESQRAFKDLIAFTNRIAKTNEQLLKPIKKLQEPLNKLKANIPKVPVFNPFAFGGTMKDMPSGGLLSPLPIKHKTPNLTILGRNLPPSTPRPKPDGAKRMAIVGSGLTSYMTRHNLKNPVDFAKAYKKKDGKDYKVTGYINLRLLFDQMNVSPEEVLLYVCEGMTSTKARWRHHRLDKEYWRGSLSVKNLVSYFDDQVKRSKNTKGSIIYTVKALWNSPYCKNMFEEYGVELPDYTTFTKWFKAMRHHVEVLDKDYLKKKN